MHFWFPEVQRLHFGKRHFVPFANAAAVEPKSAVIAVLEKAPGALFFSGFGRLDQKVMMIL